MEKLKKKGLLKRIGPVRGGYWQVVTGSKKDNNK
jgi:predicted HTH transcriptional regulator